MSNDFQKTSLLKNSRIRNFRHYRKNWRNVAVLESIRSHFEFSIHFFVCDVFPAKQPQTQRNVWKVQNTTGRFLASLHSSNFVHKILCLVPKVSNSSIVQKRSFMKII